MCEKQKGKFGRKRLQRANGLVNRYPVCWSCDQTRQPGYPANDGHMPATGKKRRLWSELGKEWVGGQCGEECGKGKPLPHAC